MAGTLLYGSGNSRGNPEVHVGHPHGQDIFLAEESSTQIVFDTIGIFPVDRLVEIKFHDFALFYHLVIRILLPARVVVLCITA
jgi:hypothetical protein